MLGISSNLAALSSCAWIENIRFLSNSRRCSVSMGGIDLDAGVLTELRKNFARNVECVEMN